VGTETLIIGHPGQDQHAIQEERIVEGFIFETLARLKMASHPCAAASARLTWVFLEHAP
jgi:hypothetical protein